MTKKLLILFIVLVFIGCGYKADPKWTSKNVNKTEQNITSIKSQ